MDLSLKIPSKTYLAGEYNILAGGNAILLSTTPYFEFSLTQGKYSHPFHAESPAGKFIARHHKLFENFQLDFHDPYNSNGGFGASGAQFIGAYCSKLFIQQGAISQQNLNIDEMLETYWSLIDSNPKPSGGDIVSQIHGGITCYNSEKKVVTTSTWTFDDIGFALIPTNLNVTTHTHLKKYAITLNESLDENVKNIQYSMQIGASSDFILWLEKFYAKLLAKNLCIDETLDIIKKFNSCEDILMAKGCGALGADVILVIYNINAKQKVVEFISDLGLNVVATESSLANQIEIQYHTTFSKQHETI